MVFDMEQMKAELEPWKQFAYKPRVRDGEDGRPWASKFGGTPYLHPNEKWPSCSSCQRLMPLFLQLNLQELPAAAQAFIGWSSGLLQLFHGADCESQCETWAPFSGSSLVRVVPLPASESAGSATDMDVGDGDGDGDAGESQERRPRTQLAAKTITGWETVEDYPSCQNALDFEIKELLENVSEEKWENMWKDFPITGAKLCGWPYWVQESEYPLCPVCQQRMENMLLQLDVDTCLDYMFGDAGCGYITQCPQHKDQLTFGWQCC